MEPPAPQPVRVVNKAVKTTNIRRCLTWYRRLMPPKRAPRKGSSSGKTAAVRGARLEWGAIGAGVESEARFVGVVMVMTTFAEPPGASVGLEPKAHVPPAGNPEQERAMVPEKTPTELR